MVQKSDGGYNYDTTDMATICHRINVEKEHALFMLPMQGNAPIFK